MKLRNLLIVVAVLAALSIAVFFVRRPSAPPSADSRLGQPLVTTATLEKAAKLRVSDQGKTVVLAKQDDGTWRVTSFYDLPADFGKISRLVGELSAAKLERLVTSNPERIGRLEFKDTKIELLDAADKELWSVSWGKNAEAGGGRFARFGSEQKAYLASFTAWLDAEAKNWPDPQLLNLKPDDIAKIEVPFAEGGPVIVSRAKKEDAWTAGSTPGGQRVKADRISSLLNSIGSVRFSETSDPADAAVSAAKANARVFKLTTFEGKSVAVTLGRKPGEKKLKPPAADTKSGPAALGSLADAAKTEPPKPLEPEFETIPAGPAYVAIAHSDASAPINAIMQKRAFQIAEHVFTGLPQNADELFEPVPAPAPPAAK
ncbi:MAG TPA: DUF4340 domain-containing protein [Opitutaceae bacterium]|nr:DUF4340 domain-containing protein [Opitutaceae bacterium]